MFDEQELRNKIDSMGADQGHPTNAYYFLVPLYNQMSKLEFSSLKLKAKVIYQVYDSNFGLDFRPVRKHLFVGLRGTIKTQCQTPKYTSMFQPPTYTTMSSKISFYTGIELRDDPENGWVKVDPPYLPSYNGLSFMNQILLFACEHPVDNIAIDAVASHIVKNKEVKDVLIRGNVDFKSKYRPIKYNFNIKLEDCEHTQAKNDKRELDISALKVVIDGIKPRDSKIFRVYDRILDLLDGLRYGM